MTFIENEAWPSPKFYFSVKFGNEEPIRFQEVSGLETETQPIEYRRSGGSEFSTIKMPGISKIGNVTLKRGIFVNDQTFWDWYGQIKMNTIKRQTVTVSLLDETGTPQMTWALQNAWPTKITNTDLKSDGNEVAIEALELTYETLEISTPS